MPAYQLQIKQVVDYPRCRIYRQFIHRLIDDRSIRASGGSGLFHYSLVVLRGWSVRKGAAENILRVPIGCHALPADEENGCNVPVL